MATKLGIQFARFAQYTAASAASNNAGTQGLRNAFANASSGPAPAWAPGLSSGGSASANSTGIGGAKFQAGKGAHSSFQVSMQNLAAGRRPMTIQSDSHRPFQFHYYSQTSGRALANANGSSASDGESAANDEDDDLPLQMTHGAAQVHRPFFQERRESIFQNGLRNQLLKTTSTLHLILPSSPGRTHVSGARSISTSTSPDTALIVSVKGESLHSIEDSPTRQRSLSTSASQEQQTSQADVGISSTAPPSSEIFVGERRSSDRIKQRRLSLLPEAQEALEQLQNGLRTGKSDVMRLQVDLYLNSAKERFSTPGFNAAMQMLLQVKDQGYVQTILDLYQQMINSDCPPNGGTYMKLVRALCDYDFESYKNSRNNENQQEYAANSKIAEAGFQQALAFSDLVHSSSYGFVQTEAYNKLLRSCAIRGDAETACKIIDNLSSNKLVSPNASTFLQLLLSFVEKGNAGKKLAEEEDKVRNAQACENVFKEFESFRNAEGWIKNSTEDVKVWNVMIRAYISGGEPEKAMEMVQKMMESESAIEIGQAAPRPDESTTRAFIVEYLNSGDVKAAANWFDHVYTLNDNLQKGQKSIMPLPPVKTVNSLFTKTMELPDFRGQDDIVANLDDQLPLVRSANRAALYIYQNADSKIQITDETWRRLLTVNSKLAEELIKKESLFEASNLSDSSLSMIEKHFDRYAGRLSWHIIKQTLANCNEVHVQEELSRNHDTIQSVIRVLLNQDRFLDAAACFSYAVTTHPAEVLEANFSLQDSANFDKLKEIALPIMGFQRNATKLEEASSNEWVLKQDGNVNLHLHLALGYIFPALQILPAIPWLLKKSVERLYLEARVLPNFAEESKIDSRGWGYIIQALLSKKDVDISSVEKLLNDLASLSEEERERIALTPLTSKLPELMGSKPALEQLQRIRSAFAYQSLGGEAPEVIAESIASVTEVPDDLNPTEHASPSTTMTSLGSPEVANEYVASLSYSLPPIQTIDADFGLELVKMAKAKPLPLKTRGLRNVESKMKIVQDQLTNSIQEQGIYPTIDAICELLDLCGRNGELEAVKATYMIGRHIVAALGGDPAWQFESWYELENSMTAALAHGGEPRLANEHRLNILQAGRVPKADTYGALITVIRDTTDEAMVAEELFDESQRLGARPTVFLYNTVLSKLSRARKAERSMQLFDEMRNRGIQPSSITYGAVLNSCTRTGDEVNAERFFSMMENDASFRPKAPPYNTMIQFYTQTKPNREKALFYYDKFQKMAIDHTTHTYKLLLDLYGSIAPIDIDAMKNIFGRLIADRLVEVQGNHWASLITSHGIHCKDLNQAVEIYHSIPYHVSSVRQGKKGKEPDALAFEAILSVFAEHKRIDLIEEYINKRKAQGCELTAYVANVLIKAYSSLVPEDGLNKARLVFEEMHDPPIGMAAAGNHPIQRQHVSGAQHSGYIEEADDAAARFGFEAVKREPSTFETMIRVEMDHGNSAEASALINRMQTRGYPPIVVARAQEIVSPQAQ